jgi:hypothetical protein
MLVLGWLFDTDRMSMRLPDEKRSELTRMLSEWPLVPGGGTVTMGQVWELCGFLQHIARGPPVGKYFVWRLNCLLQGPAWVDEQDAQISAAQKLAFAPVSRGTTGWRLHENRKHAKGTVMPKRGGSARCAAQW